MGLFKNNMEILILAGGGGKRLWPVSRNKNPKQVQPILGNKTLLEETYSRFLGHFDKKNIYISTNSNQVNFIKKAIKNFDKKNLIIEPEKKDTAAAIGLAATIIAKKNPEAIIATANSDAYIENTKAYLKILKLGEETVKNNPRKTVLVGVKPRYPETGYGYIKVKYSSSTEVMADKQISNVRCQKVLEVERFVEKPDLETAEKYIESGEYFWNPAIFIWRVDYLLNLYEKYLPEMHFILMKIQESIGKRNEARILKQEFSKIKPISIDYGIMEKEKEMLVVPGDFGWADIGHWRAVEEALSDKNKKNVIRGNCVSYNSDGNLIYNFTKKVVGICGLKDMVVIETDDALLVCPKDKAQLVKNLVEEIKKSKYKKYI